MRLVFTRSQVTRMGVRTAGSHMHSEREEAKNLVDD